MNLEQSAVGFFKSSLTLSIPKRDLMNLEPLWLSGNQGSGNFQSLKGI